MTVRRRRLKWLLTISSALTLVVLLSIALVAARAIAESHRAATDAARADLAALEDASQLQGLLYQKGFAATYVLTGDDRWLDDLERGRPGFEQWLAGITRDASTLEAGRATADLVAEYGRYDAGRDHAIAQFRAGDRAGAVRTLTVTAERAARLRDLANRLIRVRRDEVAARLADADRTWRRSLIGLALASLLAVVGAAVIGSLLARRITRPLYQLVLRAESAAGSARVEVADHDEIGAISEHVTQLARRIEESSAALAEQRARLMQAEKMSALGEMATAVAHEVLNPLTGIKAAMQLLARSNATPEVIETTAAVDEEVRRVEGMARRLMSFARPVSPRRERCELDELMPRVLQAVRSEAQARHVDVDVRLDGARTVDADPALLEQVLINLTLNACQAIPTDGPGGHVRVTARSDERAKVIEIADDGPGIAPEIAGHLFTPFATTRRDGHGLGLAISQNIALAHGGRIEARSNAPERGATFAVWLPEATS